MATVRFEGDDRPIADGSKVFEACEALGMPFGCTDGVCGTCVCMAVQGAENLAPKNDEEEDMDLKENQRLACQCVINSGLVEFTVD